MTRRAFGPAVPLVAAGILLGLGLWWLLQALESEHGASGAALAARELHGRVRTQQATQAARTARLLVDFVRSLHERWSARLPPEAVAAWADVREGDLRKARVMAALRNEAELEALERDMEPARAEVVGQGRRAGASWAQEAATLGWVSLLLMGVWALLWHRRWVRRPLVEMAGVMREVAAGSGRRVVPKGVPEAVHAGEALNGMIDALSSVRRELEERVDVNTAALASALSEQQNLNAQLRRVLGDLESAQAQLVRQEKMAALGVLARGIAHEFNNILGGIRGCAQDLLEELRDPESRESAAVIERATQRGESIVKGLQQFGEGDARAAEALDLALIAQDVLRLLARVAEEKGVRFLTRLSGPLAVLGDGAELHQVLLNLIKNACEAAPPGSEVLVSSEDEGGWIRLCILDRGGGVPPALEPRLFEPFFTTRAREGGTGLGLAISHAIVRRMGGQLTYRPRPDGGSVFVVSLPKLDEGDQE